MFAKSPSIECPNQLIELPTHSDSRGALTVFEKHLPFDVKRVYWIYNCDKQLRGGHRHHKTIQALIAVSGSVIVHMDNGSDIWDVTLNAPNKCLVVNPEDWHTLNFGPQGRLLVLASHGYDKNDYIYEPYR